MKIKTIGLIVRILIGGGLMVLLFFLSIKSNAVLFFDGNGYSIQIKKYFAMYQDSAQKETDKIWYADFNNDGTDEKIQLENGVVKVFMNDKKILETDQNWNVKEVITGDFNNDGSMDLGLYLWKTGSYGQSLPFWVKENDDSFKQHLFLYDWDKNRLELKALWHSSNLPYINVKTYLNDINKDNENELIVLERPYTLGIGNFGEYIAVWKWDEWGFTNIWRSEKGRYYDLTINK